jgi:hypothetical protein
MKHTFKILFLIVIIILLVSAVLPSASAQAATTWEVVGTPGFSSEAAWFTSLAVDQGTPYVVYQDWDKGNKATVMKFNGNAWISVGTPGFSAGNAGVTSIVLDNGTPYVAYVDGNNYSTATVMKYDSVSGDWVSVGPANFSPRYLHELAFTIEDGIPYVAYTSQMDRYKATVAKYDSGSGNWINIGAAGFSNGEADSISLAVDNGIPYVAFADYSDDSGKATVMKFDANSGNWVSVGTAGFSDGEADYVSLAINSGIVYVVYEDLANEGKATVMKFEGGVWAPVGIPGFSAGAVNQTSLVFDNGTPYVAYKDWANEGRVTVMQFDGNDWISMGAAGFSNDYIDDLSFAVENGQPYVAYKDIGYEGKATVMSFADNSPIVDVYVHGNPIGHYTLASQSETQQSYGTINDGPVKISSMNKKALIGSARVTFKVNGVNTSSSEIMGLPDHQLDQTYWLSWYNNVDLDTQLRIGNVSSSTASVHVQIGGVEMPDSPFTLSSRESKRLSFVGINDGPVEIKSDQNIVASERIIYKVKGIQTSFSEMMALPNNQLDTIYWLPWYNNVDLDTQLRVGNVSGSPAYVHVSIGGTEMAGSPFTIATGESKRLSFAGINDGPVKIESDHGVPIVATERVIYKVRGIQTSFSETMALPNNQLDTTYWLPRYNQADLDTQLRFANVSTSPATIHVYAGGVELVGSPFILAAGKSTRQNFVGVNAGPLEVKSNQMILAGERVIYKAKGINTSFSDMIGLPNSQLDTTYWLPWYNNINLDTQLRLGVP